MAKDGKFRLGIDFTDEQLRTAMRDPQHLIRWAEESGRPYLVLRTRHLVQAVTYPEGVEILQLLITAYRDQRLTIPSGWMETVEATDHTTGQRVTVDAPIMLDEQLSVDEIDAAIEQLQQLKRDALAELARRKARRE